LAFSQLSEEKKEEKKTLGEVRKKEKRYDSSAKKNSLL
jgi:hypothetical protein